MLGTLSQLVALSSAANGVVAGCIDPKSFYPGHREFKFCNSVRFVDVKKRLLGGHREILRHHDPNEWLESLASTGAARAWLSFSEPDETPVPAHQLAAFVGGGGDWHLVVSGSRAQEVWASRWEVTNEKADDDRIWSVTYGCLESSEENLAAPPADLDHATSHLLAALTETRDFALEHGLEPWPDWFQRALDSLDPDTPVTFPDYVDFVCPDFYPPVAQRLFAAAYNGWVFGGMGSWNDLVMDTDADDRRYRELSTALYAAINDAIQQASTSFAAA